MKAAAILTILIGFCVACSQKSVSPKQQLQLAQRLIRNHEFGQNFDNAHKLLSVLAATEKTTPLGNQAAFLKAKLHLDLFMAAFLSESEELVEKLKKALGWHFEGGIRKLVKFQLIAQDIRDEFHKTAETAEKNSRIAKDASLLREFADAIQAIFYKDRTLYLAVLRKLQERPKYREYAYLMELYDLVANTIESPKRPENNWIPVAQAVLTHVCPRAATAFVNNLCALPVQADDTNGFRCPQSLSVFESRFVVGAVRALGKHCRPPKTPDGDVISSDNLQDRIRLHFMRRMLFLERSNTPLAKYLKPKVRQWKAQLKGIMKYITQSLGLAEYRDNGESDRH